MAAAGIKAAQAALSSAVKSPLGQEIAGGVAQGLGGKVAEKLTTSTPKMGTQGTQLSNLQSGNVSPRGMTSGDMAPRMSLSDARGINLPSINTSPTSSSPSTPRGFEVPVGSRVPSPTASAGPQTPINPFGQSAPQAPKGSAAEYFDHNANLPPSSSHQMHGDQGVRNPNGQHGHSAFHPSNLFNMGGQAGLAGIQGGINGMFNGTGFMNGAMGAGGASLGQQAAGADFANAAPQASQAASQQANGSMDQMMQQMQQTSMMQIQFQNRVALVKALVDASKAVANQIKEMGKSFASMAGAQ